MDYYCFSGTIFLKFIKQGKNVSLYKNWWLNDIKFKLKILDNLYNDWRFGQAQNQNTSRSENTFGPFLQDFYPRYI